MSGGASLCVTGTRTPGGPIWPIDRREGLVSVRGVGAGRTDVERERDRERDRER